MPELLFHGAAGEVTGSMHMLKMDGQWVALDCGLFQGRRLESEEKNRRWPMPPREIAAVLLSHAHTDHSGRLPLLVKDGFDGPIFCTHATRDLCAVMLPDSAHIQEEDVQYLNKRRARKGLPPVEPLYDTSDALAAVGMMQSVSYDRWAQVIPGMMARFPDAGHMLGSAGIHVEFGKRNGATHSLFFSGDVGRRNAPILRDPSNFPACDTVICESTYGGRIHETVADARKVFLDAIRRAIARGGKVIVPAFAVGRTQTIVYYLHVEMQSGALPRIPIYVDSPLAVNATEVFRTHPECYDDEASTFQAHTGDMLGNGCCTYIRDVADSKALNERREPCVIISASGMCEAGRIRHHIKNNVEHARNMLLFPGFQAVNTLGRKLVDGARRITLFHEEYDVRAEVVQVHGFSGHADQAELSAFMRPLKPGLRHVYLVHGEPDQSQALAEKLRGEGFGGVVVAERDMRVTLQ